jgi:hypothetical protein
MTRTLSTPPKTRTMYVTAPERTNASSQSYDFSAEFSGEFAAFSTLNPNITGVNISVPRVPRTIRVPRDTRDPVVGVG